MTREIKFRVFVDGKMVYGDSFDIYRITLDGKIDYSQNCREGDFGTDMYRIGENIELMQWTGLKDKNGKEIYEGDIIKSSFVWNGGELAVVEWDNIYTGFEPFVSQDAWDEDYCEVIGNIYENLELLKKGLENK